jgi:hypothetical protein
MQHAKSLTRLRCCNLAINITSFLNSSEPWPEFLDSLFTAICLPSGRIPYRSVKPN